MAEPLTEAIRDKLLISIYRKVMYLYLEGEHKIPTFDRLTEIQRDNLLISIKQITDNAWYKKMLFPETDLFKEFHVADREEMLKQRFYLFIFIAFGIGSWVGKLM